MEESKELQGFYRIFRAAVYVSVLLEFFEYAFDPSVFGDWGGILADIHGRIKRWSIYSDGHLVYSKLATVLLICITCIGTRNKKHLEFNAKRQVILPLTSGLVLLVLSVWLFGHPMGMQLYTLPVHIILYMAASLAGVILVHVALDNISKYIKDGLMKDRFNFENESFEQCEEKVENNYSVNIPMRYYYKGKFRKGWVNISNPFRGTWVVGTPGSGKTFSIIEPFIRQHSAKGFVMVVYDYKFPTLATKLYYHYRKNQKLGKLPQGCKFNIINFVDVEYSRRVNPIQSKYINNLAAASETAETLLESLQKGKKEGGGGSDQFFQTSAVNFLAACIYFFVNYEKEPYDKDGNKLYAEKRQDPETKFWKPTGVVRDRKDGNIVEPAYWLGKYSDMPHILSFLNESYQTIFEVLETDNEVAPLLGPFQTAFKNKAMEQLEGMIGTLRVYTSRLATKESYWIFHKDGDDFDLKVSDPKNPSYLLIANDPEMESIIGALNALILNRLVTRVNTGQGKNIPVSIIVDELPTLYFHKIDRLIGTARSNKVSVALGFQELPQRHLRQGGTDKEGRNHRPRQDLHQSQREHGQPGARFENLRHGDRVDLRPDGEGLHQDQDRCRRLDEHTGSGGVQDHEVLLQDRFRHERNKERGSRVCAPAEVLHLSVEGGTGAHPVQELRTGRSGRKGDDKGCAEQARGEMRHARTTTAVLLLLCVATALYGQGKHGGGTPSPGLSLFRLPPLERAILCTKYHEGWHGEKKHWLTNNITRAQGDSILRADLMKLCRLFRRFGRDSTLLSCLAYQVGPYRLLGSKSIPKSRLIQKLEAGNRDIYKEYISFRCYKGRVIPSIEKRRKVEYMLLFEK